MPNIHAINAQGTEYGLEATNGITQAQSAKIETIGEVAELTTTAKQNVVSAVNEVNEKTTDNKADIGDLSALITSVKTTLVGAINSEQGILNSITNHYGTDVTANIHAEWVSEMNSAINNEQMYSLFTLFSTARDEGFLIGWKKESGNVIAVFMYGQIFGIAIRRSNVWNFYSVLYI